MNGSRLAGLAKKSTPVASVHKSVIEQKPIMETQVEKVEISVPRTENRIEHITQIPLSSIDPYEHQGRAVFNEDELKELSDSIKEQGVISPIHVVQVGSRFQVFSGERRLRASKMAGLEYIPAIITQKSDNVIQIQSIVDNIQRSDLTPLEIGGLFCSLIENNLCSSKDEVAKKLGIPRSTVFNYSKLYSDIPKSKHAELIKNRVPFKRLHQIVKSSENLVPDNLQRSKVIISFNGEDYDIKVSGRGQLNERQLKAIKEINSILTSM